MRATTANMQGSSDAWRADRLASGAAFDMQRGKHTHSTVTIGTLRSAATRYLREPTCAARTDWQKGQRWMRSLAVRCGAGDLLRN